MKSILPPNRSTMIVSRINISPFNYQSLDKQFEKNGMDVNDQEIENNLHCYLGREAVLTESGRQAIELVLEDFGLKPNDVITILTSLGTSYVSSCVTKTIEKYCKWSMKVENNTKMVLVIHEWGIPHPYIREIVDLGFPIIEDCAYAFASYDDAGLLGNYGHYAIYSLPKFFEVNFGGIACGLSKPNNVLSQELKSYLLNIVGNQLFCIDEIISKRIANWNILKDMFSLIGVEPFFDLKQGIVPGVFMFKTDDRFDLEDIKTQYNAYDVESTIYYGSNAYFIPCHQRLNRGSLEYLFNIYKAMT